MALFKATRTSTLNLQVRVGGDMALLRGIAKAVLEQGRSDPKALDHEFIDRYTQGFEDYRALCEASSWADLETQSGLTRNDMIKAAEIYSRSDRTLISWCLGLTQHTVSIIKAMNEDRVKVFVGMGGNFVLAAPDTDFTAAGLRRCSLTVQVSTKLNRSHLVHG